MNMIEKESRKKQCIMDAVVETLSAESYVHVTIEAIASRAGVGKSTIYRWWKDKPALVLDVFKMQTTHIFELDCNTSLRQNLYQQLFKLSDVLHQPVGRALLVVMAEQREAAAAFFHEYLLPRRAEMRSLIQLAIERDEIRSDYPFELMLDTLYGSVHYQIIFFNQVPDRDYICALVDMVLAPVALSSVVNDQT